MKKLVTLILAALAVVTFGAGTVASASVTHARHASSERRCSGEKIHWDTGVNYSVLGFHDYGEAHFTANPGRCSWFKTQILCLNNPPFGNPYTKTSTVYRGVNVNDKLACDLDDNGLRFSIDLNGHWSTLCTRGGNPACRW